jgi:MFS superfamily sulfate permease-like transporter/carbonic anhydrase
MLQYLILSVSYDYANQSGCGMSNLSVNGEKYGARSLLGDLSAGLVVFLIALPLSLGIALASNAPLFSGIVAGVVGGILVGLISGSHTSVSGPAAGLTAVIASQMKTLGTFEILLVAIIIAGIIQILFSIARMGYIALFFPSSVIKGLLTGIGVILILKQIPHIMGYDADPMGEKSFIQQDEQNTFTAIYNCCFRIHPGALLIGLASIALLVLWDRTPSLKKTHIPSPLIAVVLGLVMAYFLNQIGGVWAIEKSQLVQVPVAESVGSFFKYFTLPDFKSIMRTDVLVAAFTIGIVASLETLLNIEAVDKLDPKQRSSPPNRELMAQGIGNIFSGLIGGLPVTSVIVRSSVNINAGVNTKVSTIWHGILLLGSVLLIPQWLNIIPLSALAAILFVTGLKLASPAVFRQMWNEGRYQFLPFIATVLGVVFTDLLIGIIIGLCVAIGFILKSNIRYPIQQIVEKHATGDEVLHIELPNQVSFFNKASLEKTLRAVPRGGHVLLDGTSSDYIDPDILDLFIDFQKKIAPAHGIQVSLKGFKEKYPALKDQIQYVDFSSQEMQETLTPNRVLEILKEGNERFRTGHPLTRDFSRLLSTTSKGQFPMAVILSCIDSRTPVEIVFDLGLGDAFSVRIAGNVISRKVIGSLEYGCGVAGAKLILVMGHTSCGAVRAAIDLTYKEQSAYDATECTHLDSLIDEIKHSINPEEAQNAVDSSQLDNYTTVVAYRNVLRSIDQIQQNSPMLSQLAKEGKIAIIGAMYNISLGEVSFFQSHTSDSSGMPLHKLKM